ncbi:unnamed protein product [Cylindrotheca closterium]|uniref:Uncharacterized protein n=1 Tax=Cylindrotheca closterium TaxID=2856 RepID=A0AAD2JHC8_9STRA|nr:unnamed protein product [Cylindrotheca closterium]
MSNKRPFFHLGQLFSGFCPPSSFDHFETAKDDSDDGGIYGGRKTKDVVSVTVDDSPRKVKVIDRSSKTVIPKDTTSIKMNELWKDDLIHITKAETTDSGSIKKTLPLEASAEADPTAQSSPGRIIFQSTVMIGIFVLYSLAYFNQENIQSIYLDSVFELPTKHMKTVSEKTTKNLKDPIETSQDTTIDEKYVNLEFYDVESALGSQANTINGDKALSTAGDTSISSPEHGAMSEALHNIDDDGTRRTRVTMTLNRFETTLTRRKQTSQIVLLTFENKYKRIQQYGFSNLKQMKRGHIL